MSIQPGLIISDPALGRWFARQKKSLQESEWSEQDLPYLPLRGFAQRLLLAFEALQFPLRFFELQDLFFEPGDVGIRAG